MTEQEAEAKEHDADLLAKGMVRFSISTAGKPLGEVIAPDEATALAKFRDLNRDAPPAPEGDPGMILTADVMRLALAALDAQSDLPGKAWPHRGPDVPAAYPYAVVKVRPQTAETFSGNKYVQKFMVQAAVYVPVADGRTARENALKALAAALTVSGAPVVANLRNAGEKVLHAIPSTADERFDDRLREGADVLVAEVTAELLCEGDRSVP